MSPSVFLVSGASRGLGKRFVTSLLQIAAVRNPKSITGALGLLMGARGSRLIIVKIDSSLDDDALKAVQALRDHHNIDHIEVVIANAAINTGMSAAANVSAEDMNASFQINTVAPLLLFQATWPSLQGSTAPNSIGISSSIATISKMEDWSSWPCIAYGSTKAALKYIV